ncbi:MAG TPA: PAS domain-containing protein [Rhizomicrobium sp.]|nr:PAS domain-containing protein [Rhizomicrobium sp.]
MSERLPTVRTEIDPEILEHPTLGFLRDYWQAKRGSRTLPSRADIRASDLKEHLGWVLLLDVLPGGRDFRYRLIGTLVTQYWLQDSTGKTVSEAFEESGPIVQQSILSVFRKCVRDRCVVRTHGDAGWLPGGFEKFDSIYMPLAEDGDTPTHILHAFVFDKPEVMLARQIARANGGKLLEVPVKKPAA